MDEALIQEQERQLKKHIDVHGGGHEQGDDEGKALVGEILLEVDGGVDDTTAPLCSRGRRPYRKQAMQSSGMVIKQTCR